MPQLYPCSISSTQTFPGGGGSGGGGTPTSTRALYATTPAPDGVIVDFTIVGPVPQIAYIDVLLNGILQTPATNYTFDYTSATPIHFTTAPAIGDVLEAVY